MFQQNVLNAIVLKLQAIYSTVRPPMQLLVSYGMSYRAAI